jgi:chromosome segregation ATPase
MINEIYIKRAISIRKSYLKIRKDIEKYEGMTKDIVEIVTNKIKDLESLSDKISKGRFNDAESAKNEMTSIVLGLESEINSIDKTIDSLNKMIEKLKKDEIDLYNEIKLKYPNMKDSEIQSEIQSAINKL